MAQCKSNSEPTAGAASSPTTSPSTTCAASRARLRPTFSSTRTPQRGVVVGYDTRFASQRAARIVAEVIAAAGIPVQAGQRLHAHAGGFLRGEASRRGRRRDDHVQPQSVELEWREVQRQLRRLGDSGDHEEDRGGTGRGRCAEGQRKPRSKKSISRQLTSKRSARSPTWTSSPRRSSSSPSTPCTAPDAACCRRSSPITASTTSRFARN